MTHIFTTQTTKCYPNGQICFKSIHCGSFVVINEWHSNGAKLRECIRRLDNLKFVGLRREYDNDGNLELEIPYSENGILHGVQKGYYPNGSLMYEMFYDNGTHTYTVDYECGDEDPTTP